jgi:ectoine hydroxylase-related dioxygenase (phytanoyl-CoA dioxygenase family)
MTDEQRYLFDLQGYLRVVGVLSPDQIQTMLSDLDAHGISNPENDPGKSRFAGYFAWGEVWRHLIDHPIILPLLSEIIGPKLRLDHTYGMAASASAEPSGNSLHHNSGMFDHGCYYVTHGSRAHNGLVVVSYSLTDINQGDGGFCCIPGSHKALYPTPKSYYSLSDNPIAQQVAMKAGDAVIFTEALTHGTMPWTNQDHERRSVLLKYCPHYMQWARSPLSTDGIDELTNRQRAILEGAYVWQREALA